MSDNPSVIQDARSVLRGLQKEEVTVDKEVLIHALRVAEAARSMADMQFMPEACNSFVSRAIARAVKSEADAADKAIAQLRQALGYSPVE
jgi:hypothetical protein